jgi:hypothetical protein
MAVKRLFQAQFYGLAGIINAKEVEMVDRRIALVSVPKGKGWTRCRIATVQRSHDCADESRLAGAERAGKRDDVAGPKPACESRSKGDRFVLGVQSHDCR